MRIAVLLAAALPLAAQLSFRTQEIQKDFGVVYAVITADVNKDGKPDIVAINPTQLVWYQNPTWEKHVILDGKTKKDNVCVAAHDIDRDGKLDFAVGADWQPTNTAGGGSLQWTDQAGNVVPLGDEPTLHRIRFGDVDGDGSKELIVVPLHGRGNKAPNWEGDGARILVLYPPANPAKDKWRTEVADASLHIVHNFIVTDFDGEKGEEIIAASRDGLFVIKKQGGTWSKQQLGEGSPGEIKLGMINGLQRAIATVEPWHGNGLVIYEEPAPKMDPQGAPPKRGPQPWNGKMWPRQFIEERLAQAHALGWGDFDGDGADDLAAGWRDRNFGVAIYQRDRQGKWARTQLVDDGGMATEDLAIDDFNGDGLADIVAVGRKTANVRICWNETKRKWKFHEVTKGFTNHTAIAADFTGDGKKDIIVNDQTNKRTILYTAPDWKQRVLHEGAWAIHSEAFDIDGDGDIDWIGGQYSPGLIFWLERPKDPLRDAWKYHLIDSHETGGVNGVHGLLIGDIDRDGKPDLIGNSGQPTGAFPNSIAWFKAPRNVRNAKQWERTLFADKDAPGLSHYMGFGDVNGDGRPDLAGAAKTGKDGNWFAWWEAPANPRQSGWKKHLLSANEPGATNISIADLNGDGKNEFFATRGHGFGAVWFEAPNWTRHEIDTELGGPHDLALGDIDGDGDIDAVTCGKDSHIVAIFENDGRGNFTRRDIWHGNAAYDIRLTDMDNDGDLDVLVAGQNTQNVFWLENKRK
ncbi:MAG: VCBS repeat-containing protein [Acidobacteria bacterium]|nr:VCBS repeat-containing protein [Acidobacteriota bacterium]